MFILDDIFLFPVRGVAYIAQKLAEQIDLEQNDETTIQKKLLELQLLYEMDEITEEEYEKREAIIIRRLKAARIRARGGLGDVMDTDDVGDIDDLDDLDDIDDLDDLGDVEGDG